MRLSEDRDVADSKSDGMLFIDTSILNDGGYLHYRLEGSSDNSSPVLVFINDTFVNLHIWDPTVSVLKQRYPKYRILRYDIRGYSSNSIGDATKITLELLSADLGALLAHLNILRVHSFIGLGLGAHIALRFLAHNPTIASSFVGVGFEYRSKSREAVEYEWSRRIYLNYNTEKRVGLVADKAVSRWFTADARNGPEWLRVREMIAQGSAEGMEKVACAAIESVGYGDSGYDAKLILSTLDVPALFICGAGDFVLPEEMEGYPALMKEGLGQSVEVKRANRLVCCERAEEFVSVLHCWSREALGYPSP
ncbi:Alpha/Beta hydrolase protein [Suillus ampliporus]|nr:Alpha/Beta hydrolase protein [Suillus ampliporus]